MTDQYTDADKHLHDLMTASLDYMEGLENDELQQYLKELHIAERAYMTAYFRGRYLNLLERIVFNHRNEWKAPQDWEYPLGKGKSGT